MSKRKAGRGRRRSPTIAKPKHPYAPASAAAQHARRSRLFGPDACCVRCGYCNPLILIQENRSLLQEHHWLGHANDDGARVPLCPNCHAELTAGLAAAGTSMARQPNSVDRMANIASILAVTLHAGGDAFARHAADMRNAIRLLDEYFPDWRKRLEEQ